MGDDLIDWLKTYHAELMRLARSVSNLHKPETDNNYGREATRILEAADRIYDIESKLDRRDREIASLQSKLPRWRNCKTEKPTEDGEYIVARRAELFGGWQIAFDHFEVEAGQWSTDDEPDLPYNLLWMPYPEFPPLPELLK